MVHLSERHRNKQHGVGQTPNARPLNHNSIWSTWHFFGYLSVTTIIWNEREHVPPYPSDEEAKSLSSGQLNTPWNISYIAWWRKRRFSSFSFDMVVWGTTYSNFTTSGADLTAWPLQIPEWSAFSILLEGPHWQRYQIRSVGALVYIKWRLNATVQFRSTTGTGHMTRALCFIVVKLRSEFTWTNLTAPLRLLFVRIIIVPRNFGLALRHQLHFHTLLRRVKQFGIHGRIWKFP